MITIKDVAKKAGVSITTVSRVVNNSPRVSKKTREKVVKAMKELGFSPRPWAKYLAMPRANFKANNPPMLSERNLNQLSVAGATTKRKRSERSCRFSQC